MGRRRIWLLTAPILVAGLFVGHQVGYRLAITDPHQRQEALERAGHGYFAYAPYLGALFLACAMVAIGLRIRAAYPGRAGHLLPWPFALLPPLGFVLLETLERLGSHHGVSLATLVAPEFVLGLALQLPFALLALLVATLLGKLADVVGKAFRHSWSPPLLRPLSLRLSPAAAVPPRLPVAALAYGVRGPPFS